MVGAPRPQVWTLLPAVTVWNPPPPLVVVQLFRSLPMSPANQAALGLLAAGTQQARSLLMLPGQRAVERLRADWLLEDERLEPDSQEANEAATLEARRPVWAALTWRELRPSERLRLQNILRNMGA